MSTRRQPGKTSRRGFLGAAAGAAALSVPSAAVAAPYQVTTAGRTGAAAGPIGVNIPSSLAMSSGAPLGGIGTGFLELRPDGGFYEWQIFNSGAWAGRSAAAAPGGPRPQFLKFLLRTAKPGGANPQLRRLYLRPDENNLYSQSYVHDVESIDYDAWFPMTGLRYRDASLPVRAGAVAFSPFLPGKSRESGTPGFHMVFTLENTSGEAVEASLVSLLEDPLLPDLDDRMLNHTVTRDGAATSLEMRTGAQPGDQSGVGDLCLSVTGGDHTWVCGTFLQYTGAADFTWNSQRSRAMRISLLEEIFKTGSLPNAEATQDPSRDFRLTSEEIDRLSAAQAEDWVRRLSADALLRRVFADAQAADPRGFDSVDTRKALLHEVARNLAPAAPPAGGRAAQRLNWGAGALASTVKLAPGQTVEVRFALSWFFPHHLARARQPNAAPVELGHMYANWFHDAAEVNQYLRTNYTSHRQATEAFARTLADTSLGSAMAFVWSSQLGTLVKSTWWLKDGGYGIWEGLGCCGHSTTDVDYQGSHPVAALFPELKLGQSRRMIRFQDDRGRVPHTYTGDFDHVDNGFNRVDMNPQYVMMACRDYLWTGDRAYLEDVWPYIVKAMDFTASLDSNGDGLPDQNTGMQTYDQWAMRGTPSYIASLWIGGLRAAIRIAGELGKAADAARWQAILDRASASFDRLLFNGQYYRLWVDGEAHSDVCMSDQISGEWFTRLIGLPTTISEKNLAAAIESIVKYNFNFEFGLHNATAPKGGADVLAITNMQAGGVWTGIEFAFASFLMDLGRYADGARIVESVHRRYLRAGRPWNHVECGDHYSRPPSSWATLIAATGFKPDVPRQTLTVAPTVPGDFHAPWATASGFGTLRRSRQGLSIVCVSGKLSFKKLQVNLANAKPAVQLGGRPLASQSARQGNVTVIEFAQQVSIGAGQTLTVV
jgi:uncharacterized protein (DUF608 family)